MYSIYIGPQYILHVEYNLEYILDRVMRDSSQKDESSSENCTNSSAKCYFKRCLKFYKNAI